MNEIALIEALFADLTPEQKTHKIIHELAKPKPADGSSSNPGKKSWNPHRHQTQRYHTDGTFIPFPQYNFTGSVRPVYPLSPKRVVPEHIPRPDYATDGRAMSMLHQMTTTL